MMSTYWDSMVLDRIAKSADPSREYREYTLEKAGVKYKISISKEGDKLNVLISCW